MKNQNDIIVAAIAFVVLLIVVAVSFFTKRDPVIPAAPEVIDTKMPALPVGDVVMANSLPGGQSNGGGSGAGPAAPGGGRSVTGDSIAPPGGAGRGGGAGFRGPVGAGG